MKPSDIVNLSEAYETKVVSVKPVAHTIMQDDGAYDNNESDASEMAQSDVKSILHDAAKILNDLQASSKMEPWVASKITLAADYLNSAQKWLEHESQKPQSSM